MTESTRSLGQDEECCRRVLPIIFKRQNFKVSFHHLILKKNRTRMSSNFPVNKIEVKIYFSKLRNEN